MIWGLAKILVDDLMLNTPVLLRPTLTEYLEQIRICHSWLLDNVQIEEMQEWFRNG